MVGTFVQPLPIEVIRSVATAGRVPMPVVFAIGAEANVFDQAIEGAETSAWTWAEELPGTGIPDGNPPSGIAAGYVFFDICALALAPTVLALAIRARNLSPWR